MSVDRLVTSVELRDGVSGPARGVRRSTDDVAKSMDKLLGKQGGDAFRNLNTLFPSLTSNITNFANVIPAAGAKFSAFGKLLANPVGLGALAVGLTAAAAAFGAFSSLATAATGYVTGFMQAVGSYAGSGLRAFGQSIFFGLSKPFIEAAKSMDQYERKFIAIMGKTQARQMVNFVVGYAENSRLLLPELMDIARILPRLGLGNQIERMMRMVETLAVSGPGDANSNAQGVLAALQMIAGGRGEMAMRRRLMQFGVTEDRLREFGGIDDLKSATPAQMFEALARLTENFSYFKDVLASNANSIDNVLGSFEQTIMMAKAAIGKAVAEFMLPALTGAQQVIKYVSESGLLEKVTKQIGTLFGAGDENAMGRSIAFMAAAVERLSEIWDIVVEYFKDLWGALSGILSASWATLADILTQFLTAFRQPMILLVQALGLFVPAAAIVAQQLKALSGDIKAGNQTKDAFDMFGQIFEAFRQRGFEFGKSIADRAKEIEEGARARADQPATAPSLQNVTRLEDEDDLGLDAVLGKTSPLVAAVTENTKALRDMAAVVMGGGELARTGVTASDLSGVQSASAFARALEQALESLAVRGHRSIAISRPMP